MAVHVLGAVAHRDFFSFLGMHRPLLASVVVHSVALAIRFATDYRHRCAFLDLQLQQQLQAEKSSAVYR